MCPKVSVVIPTKNRANYLSSAIQSVLRQTFKDLEIIVVDGASTDNTKVVSKFADKRIRYVHQKKDRGQSASRNLGIKCSRGKFIAFLDDDDLWMPTKLERQLKIISKNPKIGLVCTGALVFENNSKILGSRIPDRKGNIFPDILKRNYIGNCSSVLIKKECLDKVGLFDENLKVCEDFDLWIRLTKYYEIDYLQEPLILLRLHEKRISTDIDRILRTNKSLFKKYVKDLRKLQKIRGFWHYRFGRLYCKCGKAAEGRKEFMKAIGNNPFSIMYYVSLLASLFGPKMYKILVTHSVSMLPTSFLMQIGITDQLGLYMHATKCR